MDFVEGVGESSSPSRSTGAFCGYDFRNDVYNRLVENGNEEVLSNPEFRQQLDAHFNRLPSSYVLDINIDRAEDVLLHMSFLSRAKDPYNRPVFHVRFLENFWSKTDDDELRVTSPSHDAQSGDVPLHPRNNEDLEPCSKLEDLNLDVKKICNDVDRATHDEDFSRRQEVPHIPIHEVIFSTIDKPKLLSQLSALLSDIGLNIREAHVFSTTDGYSLDVFVVDGWPIGDTEGLHAAVEKAIATSEESLSGSLRSQPIVEKALSKKEKSTEWEIERRLLKIGERIAAGSCGDLYRGLYLGQDVAVKVLRREHLNDSVEDEFAQEVAIMREVQHKNVVHFIGACTKAPLCIVTEYMPGGSLYDFLHKSQVLLKLPQLLSFSIDVCKGMEYLHQNNIIHRDLKTANLLMDNHNVVKVADFGVARFLNQGGVMTAETGTYRWMAPEVINHLPYDQKADVFSFAIVLWELVTAKIPYETMTPLQAALGVRQGLRPELPMNLHPQLLGLMQRCWDAIPNNRPSFTDIRRELEHIFLKVQETSEGLNDN